ncbi:hypothetical protein E2C01_042158 [Portunus trituberculatus]|uniref:Uncharacterized protein n=1 Tax=Portunus trituberculatus TaxID=210409 RepID=A0A5B7FSN3_PORTR|nr:hypothetical protein [Portunus trituberculatus]
MRVGLLVIIWSIKHIQLLSSWEVRCEGQHQVTPLPHPQHPKGGSADGNPLGCTLSPPFASTTTFYTATFTPPQCGFGVWLFLPFPCSFHNSSSSKDRLLQSSPAFTAMMDFVCEKFPEAHGPVVTDSTPLLRGMQRNEVPATTPCLRHAHPIDFMVSQASEALTRANEYSKPFFAKYSARQYYRSYTVCSDEGRSLPAKLMGTFFCLTSSGEGPSAHEPMLHQLTHSTQRAMANQARIMARRESYLSHLPNQFSSASKAHLCHLDMDSDLLFDLASVEKAIGQAQQAALVSFTEAVAKALIKVKPRLGTPFVEKHPCSSTSADSHSCPGPTPQWFSKLCFHLCTSQFLTSLFETVKDLEISEMTPLHQLLQLEAALPDICLPERTERQKSGFYGFFTRGTRSLSTHFLRCLRCLGAWNHT